MWLELKLKQRMGGGGRVVRNMRNEDSNFHLPKDKTY